MVRLTPYIRAVGRHRSSDIWVATATEAGHDMLVENIDRWLPILSKWLWYTCKTYPILIHRVPTSFDTSRDSEDVNHHLLALNTDIIRTHPPSKASSSRMATVAGYLEKHTDH